MDDLDQKILTLKDLTARTGMLHEFQVLQLKTWPIMCTHATLTQFFFDWDGKKVIFDLMKVKGRKPKDLDKRLELLAIWTRNLLGDEYSVEVRIKNKKAFESCPKPKEKKKKKP